MSDTVQTPVAEVSPAAPAAPAALVVQTVVPAKKVIRRVAVKKPAAVAVGVAQKAVAAPVAKKVVAKKVAPVVPKAPAKTAEKVSKPAAKAPKLAAKAKAVAPKPEKVAKVKKPKMIRDSFTIPKDEMAVIDVLKTRALKLAHPIKKSELIRAGIKALAALSDSAFLSAMKAVPVIKTGRPGK